MRIRAIRGENLASLAEEFEIDLMREPLSGAGVFAIVGPTGAGKTTLLDALCVALFDRTPRLANRSPFQISRGDNDPTALGAHDVRTLLRRGATAGWAEVDFESGDGRCYRARWSVRRARGSSDGNLQDQQLTLMALHGQERLGGTKTETLKAIQERLGLTFDQFRRSALLAQGDFAAFLRADGKDRSELLERMTGTEIYSRLSIAAHQRAAAAEQWLRDCRGAATAIAVMSDDARAAAASELEAARAASEFAAGQFVRAEAYARWLAEAHARRRALIEAEVEHEAACKTAEEAESLRAELALCRRAEELRELWSDVCRLESQSATLRVEIATVDATVEEAAASLQKITSSRAHLAALREPIRASRIAAQIVEAQHPASVPTTAVVESAAMIALNAAAWLGERSGLAAEIGQWPELQKRYLQRTVLAEAIEAIDRQLDGCAKRREALLADRRKHEQERTLAQQGLAVASRNIERFYGDNPPPEGVCAPPVLQLEAAGRAEDDARQRRDEVALLQEIAAKARRAAAEHAQLSSTFDELTRTIACDRERRGELLRDRDVAVAQRDERARTVADLRKVVGYAHARTELVPHEPCPLCGNTDHPWANRGAVDQLIEDAECGLVAAKTSVDAACAAIAEVDTRAFHDESELARTATLLAEVAVTVQSTVREWSDQLRAMGELAFVQDPSSAEAEAWVANRVGAAGAALDAARQARTEAVATAKAFAEAQAQVQTSRVKLEQCDAELRELGFASAAADAEAAGLRGERAAKVERRHELDAELSSTFARWTAALPDRDRALRPVDMVTVSKLADDWQSRVSEVREADAMLGVALAEADSATSVAERAVVDATSRRGELAKHSGIVNGQLADATAALDNACVGSAAGLAGRTGQPPIRIEIIDRNQLESLLRCGGQRVEELATQLDNLSRAVERARMRMAERRRLVDDHDQQRPMIDAGRDGSELQHGVELTDWEQLPAAVDAAEQRVAELATERAAAEHRAAGLAATLAADDEARARRDAAFAAFAAAERAAEVDRVLGEVIGSHDGKLFRSFAQSLTLDSLLAVANAHLEDLAPRYQLERVPKHDLELQVLDRDFAGEVRSVQSLSGGECFLVSLALALGLSSMSAHDVRVRTLLIDEGFGTLDPATLDGALAVLDELQATGRQVGIISHVPALLDRVRAHVRVAPRGGGRSRVVVPGCGANPVSLAGSAR